MIETIDEDLVILLGQGDEGAFLHGPVEVLASLVVGLQDQAMEVSGSRGLVCQ